MSKQGADKTPHGQNVTGQNATLTKCHRTKRHTDKISYGQNVMEITPQGQNATGQNAKMPHRRNTRGQNTNQMSQDKTPKI